MQTVCYDIPMPIKLHLVVAPFLFLAVFQLAGCTNLNRSGQFPPGGTYLSNSAGANFDQSVVLAEDSEQSIAPFPLRHAHRPTHNSNLIYIAAGEEGIVASEDGGRSWRVIATPLAQVIDVALLQNGTTVATGVDGDGRGFIIRRLSEDSPWEVVLTVPVPVDTKSFQIIKGETLSSVVLTIAVDPFDLNRLYAGSNLGTILAGEQSAKTWRTIHSVESSRFDPSGTRQNLGIEDLLPSPHAPGEILLLTFDKTLYRLQNGAQTEIKVPLYINTAPPFGTGGTQTRKVLDANYIPSDPNVLLAATSEGIVITPDNGATWGVLSVPIETTQNRGFNSAVITTSPTNPSRILVAINSVLYRSEDAGASWNTFDFHLPSHIINAILIDPTNAANVLVVTSLLAS